MADQILSQEEIDALLSAMDSGEIDVDRRDSRKSPPRFDPMISPHRT
jgi:flagellar motor switch protein FliM